MSSLSLNSDAFKDAKMKNIFIICTFLSFTQISLAQEKDLAHSILADRPTIGSNVREKVGFSKVAMHKRYEDLSESDKAILRKDYVDMQANDEPPFPLYGLAPIFEKIARMHVRRENEGKVKMLVLIDANGEAQNVRFVNYPTLDTAKAIAKILVSTKFKPGRCDGTTCPMEYLFDIDLQVTIN